MIREVSAGGLGNHTTEGLAEQLSREARCDVYWARTASLRPTHLRLLADVEVARRARYHRAEDRDRFTLAAVLLRLVIGVRTGGAPAEVSIDRTCPRCMEPHGRPRVIGHAVEVSVAHSGEFAGVALTGAGPVGMDVEHVRPLDHAALTSEVCAREENETVTSLAEFYTLWTRKESVLKATGVGLELPMAEIRVSAPHEPAHLLGYAGDAQMPARMADVSPAAGYAGAVTVLTSAPVAFRERAAADLLEAVCASSSNVTSRQRDSDASAGQRGPRG